MKTTTQQAALRLFNCVIGTASESRFYLNGVVTNAPIHLHDLILSFYQGQDLSFEQLNHSFYTNWDDAANASLNEQLRHYLTVWIEDLIPGLVEVYLPPRAEAKGEEKLKVKVFQVLCLSQGKMKNRVMSLLNCSALKRETIDDCLVVLKELLTPEESVEIKVNNREAQCLLWDGTGLMPSHPDDILRLMVFKATGQTLFDRNKKGKFLGNLRTSGFELPNFSIEVRNKLASFFLRNKYVWLAFKKANGANAPLVNDLRRRAVTNHKPLNTPMVKQLTWNFTFSNEEVKKALSGMQLHDLVKLMDTMNYYSGSGARIYRIRNGKRWFQELKPIKNPYLDLVKNEIKSRMPAFSLVEPEGVAFTLPSSSKDFVGLFPNGTRITIPHRKGLKLGIHWFNREGQRVDLDLSAVELEGAVGWNSTLSTGCLQRSYDMTNPDKKLGASEFLYVSNGEQIKEAYLVKVNDYTRKRRTNTLQNTEFKFIIAHSPEEGKDDDKYCLLNPKDVTFSSDITSVSEEYTLGILVPGEKEDYFYLFGGETGASCVSATKASPVEIEAVIHQVTSRTLLRDLANDKKDGVVIDLTGTLTADSFTTLFS